MVCITRIGSSSFVRSLLSAILSSPSTIAPTKKYVPSWPGQLITAHWGRPRPAVEGTPEQIQQAFLETQRLWAIIAQLILSPSPEVLIMSSEAALAGAAAPSPADVKIMQLATSYWASRCLHVVAELGIADLIGEQPQSTESLAKSSGTQPNSLYRVLRLLASVGIFAWEDGAWRHTDSSRFLRSDHPGSLRDYVRMLGLPVFWSAFADLDHSLHTGEPAFAKQHPEGVFGYLSENLEESSIFNAAMTSKSHRDIAAILPAYDFSQFASIADIAGGRGHLLRAILRTSPKTHGILFDQPHVVADVAPDNGEKLTVVSGNFFTDAMPKADAYLLMNIIHDWPDAQSIKILSAIRRDMPSHARVLIIETVVPPTPGAHLSKELDIAMMVVPGGMERTREEYAGLAAKCGLQLKLMVETVTPYSILEMVAA